MSLCSCVCTIVVHIQTPLRKDTRRVQVENKLSRQEKYVKFKLNWWKKDTIIIQLKKFTVDMTYVTCNRFKKKKKQQHYR